MSLPSDYQERAKANNFASPKEILDALNAAGTVVLDVRTADEIAAAKLDTPDHVSWTATGCTRTQCPALETDPTQFVPSTDTTVVVYCASGARAAQAARTLQQKGYTRVLNGGGLKDMLVYPKLKL